PAAADIQSVRVVGDGELTRITMWADAAVEAEIFLSGDAVPGQILVALDGAQNVSGPPVPVPPATGVSAYGWQSGFLSFTLARPMMVARQLNLPPTGEESRYRIVIDLAAVSQARFRQAAHRNAGSLAQRVQLHMVRSAAAPAPSAASQTAPMGHDVVLEPIRPPRSERYLVVIDPGHGGRDPGAIAASGLREKDVVLQAAHTLKDLLEEAGRYEVRLTRTSDEFIELEDRVTRARNWGADLFISIHADAAANRDVAGASVYTISERGEGRIERESERNDWHIELEDGVSQEVGGILEALTLRETKSNSGYFASLLLPELAEAGPVLRNTHREAGFYVLLAPDVPALLLEMGFLTNGADARRLAGASGRRKAMEAVRDAIDTYFDRQDLVLAEN
ncbi:MAG: N-acetylmuramoyl-L-alanine amidase, partial [Hyphomonadaceae bacterium]|nr:N-acetylmuramoyl-L-alanine amidase [Hyphomonadaceae bacterium]